MTASAPHPIQPLITDGDGRQRFKENAIVRFLLDRGPFDMNQLAAEDFSREDREQFAQLIGYSLAGFGELSYASDFVYEAAQTPANEKVAFLESKLAELRATLEQIKAIAE